MSSSEYDSPYGFPLRRNGSCLSDEVSCGHTWGDFYACCPGNTICPGTKAYYYNSVCCPSWSNCTIPLMESPHCANSSGSLFDHTGYFCCLPNQTGFWTSSPTDAVGCSDGFPDNVNETIIAAVSSASVASSSLATATSTSIPTSGSATDSTTNAADNSSGGNHTGAIAGGVVGGVAGLAIILALLWFFLRRRKQKQQPDAALGVQPTQYTDVKPVTLAPGELDGLATPSELPADNHLMHELPAGKGHA
ncbi:hypothetical protein BDV59DRAFT_180688 [Aspergillus ambiguus]|uniref:uncharacterized protein n=1 Tax=Aspergillus ambiguus TaxID=176160 RepID=UPI003CCD2014